MNLKSGWNRRSFLGTLGAAAGSLFSPKAAVAKEKDKDEKHGVDGHAIVPIKSGLGSTGDVYAELGVKPLVNIVGTVTVIGGSVMKPEVMELMRRANILRSSARRLPDTRVSSPAAWPRALSSATPACSPRILSHG
jgi:L-seryl-tRNA(Ser) seleniumtransferase